MLGLFKCCVASLVLIQLQFYVLCNCFLSFAHLLTCRARSILSTWFLWCHWPNIRHPSAHNCFLLTMFCLWFLWLYRSHTGRLFDVFRIKSQIWQWPFHAMFIYLVTMRFFLAQFRFLFLFWFRLWCFFFSSSFFVIVFISHVYSTF